MSILETHPTIAAQWHPQKNVKSLENVTYGSGYKAWWVGTCGHEWQARVGDRTHRPNVTMCPSCTLTRSGSSCPHWRGCGEISKHYWLTIQNDARRRDYQFALDINEAWLLFLKQNGRCALSGLPIQMGTGPKRTASLDRINNSLGYIPGNVQWVHKVINSMKSTLAQDEFIQFCCTVAHHQES